MTERQVKRNPNVRRFHLRTPDIGNASCGCCGSNILPVREFLDRLQQGDGPDVCRCCLKNYLLDVGKYNPFKPENQ